MQQGNRSYRWWSLGAAFLVLCLTVGALLVRQPAKAQEEVEPRYFAMGAIGLVRGQTSRHIFYLPAVQRNDQPADCHLIVSDTDGDVLVDTTFTLAPGGTVTSDLSVLNDGRVRFNNKTLKTHVGERERLEIIPCFFVGHMQKGAPFLATAQCAPNLNSPKEAEAPEPVRLGATTYIFAYREQETSEYER